ncbi:hypothetical protein [Eremococcus coleocola]|uniref:DivIVA domain protein n=1 Tax=Eremococcus coleocola ACS-139-V-Col8 TaxID=908337 RepID=E4KPD5_9LACT|nr:hypothetical protein [Eremococcus coleocola]EFR31068.1 hypothetical protein HMPREF9257_1422 [Eremococcus coleocola ACS-139-V-Col8]
MEIGKELSSSLFGYKKSQVDHLLGEQKQKIADLQAQLAQAQSEIEKYKELEASIKDSILDSRQKGNQIIQESNDKAVQMINQTEEQITQYKEDFVFQSQGLIESGVGLKDQLKEMKNRMQAILEEYQDMLDTTNFDKIYPKKKIEQFSLQVENFETESMDAWKSHQDLSPEANLSEAEKAELQKLISDVIDNENKEENKEDKSVESDQEKIRLLFSNNS